MTEEKFVLVSLDDEKSKDIAEVISNKTSRKILDYLSDKEGSSTDICNSLDIALSTVEYNLKNLVKSGLVESSEFKWSPKGRQMDIYKVKKKYIVIVPGKTTEIKEILRKILPISIIGVLVSGVLEVYYGFSKESSEVTTSKMADSVASGVAEMAPIIAEDVKEIVSVNPHYGLWFFLGLIVALGLFLLFSLRKR